MLASFNFFKICSVWYFNTFYWALLHIYVYRNIFIYQNDNILVYKDISIHFLINFFELVFEKCGSKTLF